MLNRPRVSGIASPDGLYILFDHPEFTAESGWIFTLRKVPSTRGTVVNLTRDRGAGSCGGSAWRPLHPTR